MNTDRRRHDPFAPRHKAQTQTAKEPATETPDPEAPAAPPNEPPAESTESTKLAPDFAAILDEIPNDIDHITLKELRALAGQAGVADYGTKAEIIARLRAAAQ